MKPIILCAALIWLAPDPAAAQRGPRVDVPGRAAVESLLDTLVAHYVFPEVARTARRVMLDRLARGDYDAFTDPSALAERWSEELYGLTLDKHLRVSFSPRADPPPGTAAPSPDEDAARRRAAARAAARANHGFRTVDILDGNVGYLDLRAFHRVAEAGEVAAAAMRLLAQSEAVIIDLRSNGGGSPGMVALLSGYFFPGPVHLFDQYERETNDTVRVWTPASLPGPLLVDQPLYLLTGPSTFSAPEGFAYLLQQLDRALVVGERTAGAANTGRPYRISSDFEVVIPNGRVTSPVTGRNWEGVGVAPDVDVPADQALVTAHRLAVEELRRREPEPERVRQLDAVLERLRGRR